MNDDGKLNLLPFLGDISLLIVIFFIAVIIAQQLTIKKSEKPYPIQTDTFFGNKEYELDSLSKLNLKNTLSDEIFEKSILPNFKDGRLKMLRIEGHTDSNEPKREEGRKWQTNRELSFLRANTVSTIFEEIAAEKMSDDRLVSFKSVLFPGGKGQYNPLNLDIVKKDSLYYVSENDTLVLDSFKYRWNAGAFINSKNRRIEIQQVLK